MAGLSEVIGHMPDSCLRVQTLDPADFERWVAFCAAVFGEDSAYFRRHFMADPDHRYESVFLIRDGKDIVSSLRVFHRKVWLNGHAVSMAGIGEVATRESHRRMGLSGKLLETAGEYIAENGFTLSLLLAEYAAHYARHGYMPVKARRKVIAAEGGPRGQYDLRPLGQEHFADMAALYNRHSKNCSLSTVRSPAYWHSWCAGEMHNPTGLFRKGVLAGYVCYQDAGICEIIGPSGIHDILLLAVQARDGKLDVPGMVNTSREVLDEYEHCHTMIKLFRPLSIFGKTLHLTSELVAHLDDHGGAAWWIQDAF